MMKMNNTSKNKLKWVLTFILLVATITLGLTEDVSAQVGDLSSLYEIAFGLAILAIGITLFILFCLWYFWSFLVSNPIGWIILVIMVSISIFITSIVIETIKELT